MKFLMLSLFIFLSGCSTIRALSEPGLEKAAYYAHEGAAMYCMMNDQNQTYFREKYLSSETGVWAYIYCQNL